MLNTDTEYTNDLSEHMAGVPTDVVAEPPTENVATVTTTVTINGESETFTATGTSVEVGGFTLADGLRFSVNDEARNWLAERP